MLKKPIAFTPQLFEAQGINNYSGKAFRCFTKGDTLPFRVSFKDADGNVPDVTDYEVWVYMSDQQAVDGVDPQTQNLLEVQIPMTDLAGGVFEGNVSDTQTNSLPPGLVYAQLVYVDATGTSFIIDMALLEVYPAVPFTVL